ncbi:helix-turn-helix domain-containing protein [Streptomyces flaveus]|uniref:helix-turn-helix domain-containing protein n=1 Tax=Streptomyces flaveus TaxID=66370 RepID=UPI003330E6E5
MDEGTPDPRAQTPQAAAYAAKLEAVLQPAVDAGLTRSQLAQASHHSKSSITRYLQGKNVAPAEFVAFLAEYLATLGHALSQQDVSELHSLRRNAEKTSPKPDTRVRAWEEEVSLLKDELSQSSRRHEATAARLADFQTRLDALDQELSGALARAETAERQRDELRELAAEQERQLDHARAYSRQTDSELARSETRARELQREVDVLRRQVRRLQKEDAASGGERSVPDAATQVGAVRTSAVAGPSREAAEGGRDAAAAAKRWLRRASKPPRTRQSFEAAPASTPASPWARAATARFSKWLVPVASVAAMAGLAVLSYHLARFPGDSELALAHAQEAYGVDCEGSCRIFRLDQAAAFDADRWGISAADDADLIADPKEAPFSYGLKALNEAALRGLPATKTLDARRCSTVSTEYTDTVQAADGAAVCLLTADGTRVMLMRMGKTSDGAGRLFIASVDPS